MFDLNLKEYDENSDDILSELKRIKKTDTIEIKDIMLNPLNPSLDNEEEIKVFAEKIYHNPDGVIENISVYKLNDGRYMLLSGHKRVLACKYNIEHQDQLDGTGIVQKTILANILKKPKNTLEEMNLILDFNDYRRLERFEQKYEVFLKYYQIVAVMIKNKSFKGRIREYISMRSGLGLKTVGQCIDKLKNDIYKLLLDFCDEINDGNSNYTVNDKYSFLEEKTNLPIETITLVVSKIRTGKPKDKQVNNGEIKEKNRRISQEISNKLNLKVAISEKKVTISFKNDEEKNKILQILNNDFYSDKINENLINK